LPEQLSSLPKAYPWKPTHKTPAQAPTQSKSKPPTAMGCKRAQETVDEILEVSSDDLAEST